MIRKLIFILSFTIYVKCQLNFLEYPDPVQEKINSLNLSPEVLEIVNKYIKAGATFNLGDEEIEDVKLTFEQIVTRKR